MHLGAESPRSANYRIPIRLAHMTCQGGQQRTLAATNCTNHGDQLVATSLEVHILKLKGLPLMVGHGKSIIRRRFGLGNPGFLEVRLRLLILHLSGTSALARLLLTRLFPRETRSSQLDRILSCRLPGHPFFPFFLQHEVLNSLDRGPRVSGLDESARQEIEKECSRLLNRASEEKIWAGANP